MIEIIEELSPDRDVTMFVGCSFRMISEPKGNPSSEKGSSVDWENESHSVAISCRNLRSFGTKELCHPCCFSSFKQIVTLPGAGCAIK